MDVFCDKIRKFDTTRFASTNSCTDENKSKSCLKICLLTVAISLLFLIYGSYKKYNVSMLMTETDVQHKDKILLVLFTSFHFTKNRENVYNNTMINWPILGPGIQPVLFIDNMTLAGQFVKHGWHVYSTKRVTIEGNKVPVLKQMFAEIQLKYNSYFVGFANADILFTSGLLVTMETLKSYFSNSSDNSNAMIVGRRIDVTNMSKLFVSGLASNLSAITEVAQTSGTLHAVWGLDLFVTNHNYPWYNLPEFFIGRVRYDNWMIMRARKNGHMTIDVTKTVLMLHQSVDAGSREKKYKNDEEFDINMSIIKLYYKGVHMGVGTATCTSYFTSNNSSKIRILRKHVPEFCYKNYENKFS